MNTNNQPHEDASTSMRVYVLMAQVKSGPFTIEEIEAMKAARQLTGDELAHAENHNRWLPLNILLEESTPANLNVPSLVPHPQSPASTKPELQGEAGCYALLLQPMLKREDALMWITVTTWIYIVLAAVDLFIGLIPVAVALVVFAIWLKSFHSRFAAIVLLTMAIIAFVVTFGAFGYLLSFLTLCQITATARAVEATFKLRKGTLP